MSKFFTQYILLILKIIKFNCVKVGLVNEEDEMQKSKRGISCIHLFYKRDLKIGHF